MNNHLRVRKPFRPGLVSTPVELGGASVLASRLVSRLAPPQVAKRAITLVSVALIVVLCCFLVTRPVWAKITYNTIDTIGIVTDKGRSVLVTGPIAITEGERTELRVTMTQRSTGAVAEGVIFFSGNGQTNQWNSLRRPKVAQDLKLALPWWSASRAVRKMARPLTPLSGWCTSPCSASKGTRLQR